jgi:hypothetical protein
MVRAKLSCDAKTKQFEWTILDAEDSPVLYIETPNHNLIVLRNYLLVKTAADTFSGCLALIARTRDPVTHETWTGEELMSGNVDWLNRYRLANFIQMALSNSQDTIFYYHPILQQEIQSKPREHVVMYTLTAICTDILNHVLEHDEKQRRLAIEEHRLTRVQHAEEFAALGSNK